MNKFIRKTTIAMLVISFAAWLSACSGTPEVIHSLTPKFLGNIKYKQGQDRTVALVLGGGGIRGFAHIGVLQALEEAGIRPDIIVGTSAGAVVGVAFASGMSA